jgi:hypothetical protein
MPKPNENTPEMRLRRAIEAAVLQTVGRPFGFIKIEAVNVFGKCWRVNMWAQIPSVNGGYDNHIVHSYFLTVVEDAIVDSHPPLGRSYPACQPAGQKPEPVPV